jgi:glycosyltransferase involved in cell wall biosynthesis
MLDRGHEYTVFAQRPTPVEWMTYRGQVQDWSSIEADVLLIGDPPSFPALARAAGTVYVWVIAGGEYMRAYVEMHRSRQYPILVNNRIFLSRFPSARLVEGGVNTSAFRPGPGSGARRVGYYAGRGAIKGEDVIVKALGDLGSVHLVPISGFSQTELVIVYRSLHYFVCAEQRDGWPNTAAEALACGVPVVSTSRNTEPFGGRVIVVDDLRTFFEAPMADFSWERVGDRLEEIWKEDGIEDS